MSDDHETIRNLLGTYCELMDAGDWDGLAALFANATLTDEEGNVAARGAEEVRKLYAATVTYDGSPRTRHLTTNTVIDVTADTAHARSAFVVLQAVEGFNLQPIISGRYRDSFARTDGEWHFTERVFMVDHVGDLSRHLPYEVPQP
jgi:3-phenylpropionate/cinnamic acid dioxygenase small subunit